MSDRFVNEAKERMDALSGLIKGLPGIQGYIDKELRRDADKRLRTLIAEQLNTQRRLLLDAQKGLLKSGGLQWVDDVDEAVSKMQILIDRVKTASMGYAGLFDPVPIGQEQLNALHRFDVALAQRVSDVSAGVSAIAAAVSEPEGIEDAVAALTSTLSELSRLFDRRNEAVVAPELLLDTEFVPPIEEASA